MDPFSVLAIAQGAVGLGQTIGSWFKKDKRPEYKMPDALKQSLALAQMNVGSRAPGYSQAVDEANLITSNQLGAVQNRAEAVQGIAGAQQAQMRDINRMDAESERQDRLNLQNTLSQVAQAQDQEFAANELAPYQDAAREKRDMFGAGMENIFGALNLAGVTGQSFGFSKKKKAGNSVMDVLSAVPKLKLPGG